MGKRILKSRGETKNLSGYASTKSKVEKGVEYVVRTKQGKAGGGAFKRQDKARVGETEKLSFCCSCDIKTKIDSATRACTSVQILDGLDRERADFPAVFFIFVTLINVMKYKYQKMQIGVSLIGQYTRQESTLGVK